MKKRIKMKMFKSRQKKNYAGFSLLEMIITVAIISILIVFVSFSITTMIRSSIISTIRFESRNETELIFELIRKNISQTDPSNIRVYNSLAVRNYDRDLSRVVGEADGSKGSLGLAYQNPLDEGVEGGNEIHILPSGSTRWICIGYFETEDGQGYIVKTSYPSFTSEADHQQCFNSTTQEYRKNAMVLNSDTIDVQSFSVNYYLQSSGNAIFTIDTITASTKKYGAQEIPELTRQLVVTTQKLTF